MKHRAPDRVIFWQKIDFYPSCAMRCANTVAQRHEKFPVAISEGSHPFPSRTRKLSPPEPMVLRGKPRGRVGRCRIIFDEQKTGGGRKTAAGPFLSKFAIAYFPARLLR